MTWRNLLELVRVSLVISLLTGETVSQAVLSFHYYSVQRLYGWFNKYKTTFLTPRGQGKPSLQVKLK